MSNKTALLIGINKYPFLANFAQLKGCENDVLAIEQILEQKFEFPKANIHTLLDEDATRLGILDAMKSVAAGCGEDDTILFYFSGHGSRLRAREENKPSGWYETIMPFDSGRRFYHPEAVNRDICDDEIYEWLMSLSEKTSNIVLIFDSCYSGSILRDDVFEQGCRSVAPDDTVLHEDPRLIFPHQLPFNRNRLSKVNSPSGWLPVSDKYVLMAACAEYEHAHVYKQWTDEGVIEYGVFTYFLSEALRDAKSGDTYRDIWERVYLDIKGRFGRQNAQLEGNRDRELFGSSEFRPTGFVPVTLRQHDHVILAGGAVHGVRRNSQWAIYPSGTKSPSPARDTLGIVKVTAVQAVTAKARIIDENVSNSIKGGNRAIEISRPPREARLKIQVENALPATGERFDKLVRDIGQSTLLKVVAGDELPDVKLQVAGSHFEKTSSSSKLPAKDSIPICTVNDRSNSLQMPPQPLTGPASNRIIIDNLEAICRYRRVLDLRNPKSIMSGRIDFSILKQNEDLSWGEIEPSEVDSKVIIHESDRIALRVINRFDTPIFFTILDLRIAKNISLLYPPHGASVIVHPVEAPSDPSNERAILKGVCTIGMVGNGYFAFSFPDNYPFSAPASDIETVEKQGLEIFKLIATTYPHDLSFLEQAGVRTSQRPENMIEEKFYHILRGTGDFDGKLPLKWKNEWLTIEKAFLLKEG